MDPWSRRQQPFKVPKLRWYHRHFGYIRIALVLAGTAIFLSRPLYEIFLKDYVEGPRPRIEITLKQLMQKPKEGEGRKPWSEFLAEQHISQQRAREKKEKERLEESS